MHSLELEHITVLVGRVVLPPERMSAKNDLGIIAGGKSKRRKFDAPNQNSSIPEGGQKLLITLGNDGTAVDEKPPSFKVEKVTKTVNYLENLIPMGQNKLSRGRKVVASQLKDGGIITLGVGSLIHQAVLKEKNPDCGTSATICHKVFLARGTLDDSIVHISQPDSWSCGYRNAQMMLFYLLPRLATKVLLQPLQSSNDINKDESDVIDLTGDDPSPVKLGQLRQDTDMQQARLALASLDIPPTISNLQEQIEKSWKTEGFDPKGAEYFRYNIRNSKARIGAVEVASLFRYWYVDATIVQFVNVASSRRMLGPFVWTYFAGHAVVQQERTTNNHCASVKSYMNHKDATAQDILNLAEEKWRAQDEISHQQLDHTVNTCCCCPLYLQWDGHSVLVVGIERIQNNTKNDNIKHVKEKGLEYSMKESDFNLLIFDPSKKGCGLKAALGSAVQNRGYKQNRVLDSIRLTTKGLCHEDIQIIHCSQVMLTSVDRLRWKSEICAITATGYKH